MMGLNMLQSQAERRVGHYEQCEEEVQVEVCVIVDVDHNPELAEAILDGSVYRAVGPGCGDPILVDMPLLVYRWGKLPAELFSTAQATTPDEDREDARPLIEQLRSELGAEAPTTKVSMLPLPRPVLPVALAEQDRKDALRLFEQPQGSLEVEHLLGPLLPSRPALRGLLRDLVPMRDPVPLPLRDPLPIPLRDPLPPPLRDPLPPPFQDPPLPHFREGETRNFASTAGRG